jgi:hypothetical protein
MSALDRLIAKPRRREIDTVDLAAPPERVWELVRHGNLGQSLIARMLFALRTVPDRIANRAVEPPVLRLDDLRSSALKPGFQILIDDAPHEVAVGAIGKVWQLAIPFAHVSNAEAFGGFTEPGWVRVAWALRVLPRGTGSRLELEVRVDATDDASWNKFRWYFRLIGPFSRWIRRGLLASYVHATPRAARSRWRDVADGLAGAARMALDFVTPTRSRTHWGLSEIAARRAYPGDALVPVPSWSWTHAIEIAAPAERVWPWVAQIGADRGGFYSYQWLENLAGCDVSNAEEVHPEWEHQMGDGLVLHPEMPALRVVELVPGRHFVGFAAPEREDGKPWVAASWLFFIEPLNGQRCRFISRYRVDTSPDLRTRIAFGERMIEPIGFAMDRRMLLGVKERAERSLETARVQQESNLHVG